MRAARTIVCVAAAACAAFACNFIVDAEFNGKVLPGQDGAPPASDCPLATSATDPGCRNCMLTTCKSQFAAICKDGNKGVGTGYLEDCASDPSVNDGKCASVFVDGGQVSGYDDPAAHWYNMRLCVTQSCKSACTTCTGLTYQRSPDNKAVPLTADTSTCAACLLQNCQGALIGGGTEFSHCCYQDRIDETWGPCVRPSGSDCSMIKMWAATDGGAGGCDYTLSRCAADMCQGSCKL